MAATRLKSQDYGDSTVATADIQDAAVTFSKLQLATAPGLEDSTGIRVKIDAADPGLQRTSDGLSVLLNANGGLSTNGGLGMRGFNIGALAFNAAGDAQYLSGNKAHQVYDGIAVRDLGGTIATKTVVSQTVASTASETFFNTDQQYTLPANWFVAGRRLRIRGGGRYGLDASGSPTVRFRVNMGAVPLIDTGAQNPLTSASLNRNWAFDMEVVCAVDGSSGSVQAAGWFLLPTGLVLPQSSVSVSFNTTGSALIATSVQFSASSATNRAQMHMLAVEGS